MILVELTHGAPVPARFPPEVRVEQNLAGRSLDPNSAIDNVSAGSMYLAQLMRDAGGDEATAIASYYQGEASVRAVGMLPETQRYVANVMALRGRFGG